MTENGLPSDQEIGRVKFFSISRQFGFIQRPDGSDIFLHHSAIVHVSGNCYHARGICSRAIGLLPASVTVTIDMRATAIERLLRNAGVKYRIVETPWGPEARSVKRA